MDLINYKRTDRECWIKAKRHPISIDYYSVYVYISLLSICVLTIMVLAVINYKVIRIVGIKDLVLVLMLLFLKLSLLAYAIFFGFQASLIHSYVCFSRFYYCMTGMFIGWPGVFLALALVLTCNKWIYYIIYV